MCSAFDDLMDGMMATVVDVMGSTIKLWKPTTNPSANSSTMKRTKSYDSVTLQGSDRPVEKRTIDTNGRTAMVDVYTYDIRLADCTIGTPDESWLLSIGSDSTEDDGMKIISAQPDAQMKGCVIRAAKGG